ncbi:MAG: hypothetical protein GX774_10165 [Armatimonadetes bacterium]|nr:hypothetical protein [Armatimonadota bacterium]
MNLRSHQAPEGLPSRAAMTQTTPAPMPEDPARSVLQWRVHLARRRPAALVPLLLVLTAALVLAHAVFRHPLPVALTALVLLSAVAEYLLPVVYRLTPSGVTRRNGLSYTVLEWERVRRVQMDDDGVKLSPLGTASPLEAFRGVYLRFPEEESLRARLEEALRVYCPAADLGKAEETDAAR